MFEFYHDIPERSTKICTKCHVEKPLDAFSKANTRKIGYKAQCKACSTLYNRSRKTAINPIVVSSKVCTQCHIEKPLDAFHKYAKSTDGHRGECKECRYAEYKQTYQPRKKPLPPVTKGGKVCRKCHIEKPLTDFYPDKRASDKLGTQCKECVHYRCYVLNQEETHARTHRNWEKNGEKYKETHRKWEAKNSHVLREVARRRDALLRNVTIGEVDYDRVLEQCGMWCHICEQPILPDQKMEFDHVVPISRGGMHIEENIKVSHKVCNRRKKNRLMEELTPYHRRGIQ
jgi:5-methylcytosine-specific restriction endonuclease McrA